MKCKLVNKILFDVDFFQEHLENPVGSLTDFYPVEYYLFEN